MTARLVFSEDVILNGVQTGAYVAVRRDDDARLRLEVGSHDPETRTSGPVTLTGKDFAGALEEALSRAVAFIYRAEPDSEDRDLLSEFEKFKGRRGGAR